MSQVVLDASAVLAYLWKEKGRSKVEQHLLSESVMMSSVNLAEVASKALERGMDPQIAREMLATLGMQELVFDSEAAWECALLRVPTRLLGLSLGDRPVLLWPARPEALPSPLTSPGRRFQPKLRLNVSVSQVVSVEIFGSSELPPSALPVAASGVAGFSPRQAR